MIISASVFWCTLEIFQCIVHEAKIPLVIKTNSSLVNRFGLSIFYAKPNKEGFNEMAVALARRAGITPEVMTDEEICYEANRFEMRGGGLSGRTAQQFANYLLTIK